MDESARTEAGSPWRRWAREPLVHFAAIAVLIFAVQGLVRRDGARDATDRRVVLTPEDVERLVVAFRGDKNHEPDAVERAQLVEDAVKREILYREAVAMGLDRDDSVIKGLLAQKLLFIGEESKRLPPPTDADLQGWMTAHPQRFTTPERISFHQVFFAASRVDARGNAEAALRGLAADATPPAADPPPLGEAPLEQTRAHVAKALGDDFAGAVFRLAPGSWNGPVPSTLGWHLVRVDAVAPAATPPFAEVSAAVALDWQAAQRERAADEFYRSLKARYRITVPDAAAPARSEPAEAATNGAPR